jgi:gliding motility-associated-like protein
LTSYSFTEPGCWNVTLTITTAEECVGTVTIPNYICVFDYPTADFTFGPQPTNILNPIISFNNESFNADTYNWIFDANGTAAESQFENPTYTFPSANPGTYEVCLEAITINGCNDVICQNVLIDQEFIIYVPNAFTPGGGDLINNKFMPIVKGEDPLKYSFMVFNRWGELIFETSYASQGWDGTYKGIMSKQDVYVWKVTCLDASSRELHEYIGHVTLVK